MDILFFFCSGGYNFAWIVLLGWFIFIWLLGGGLHSFELSLYPYLFTSLPLCSHRAGKVWSQSPAGRNNWWTDQPLNVHIPGIPPEVIHLVFHTFRAVGMIEVWPRGPHLSCPSFYLLPYTSPVLTGCRHISFMTQSCLKMWTAPLFLYALLS